MPICSFDILMAVKWKRVWVKVKCTMCEIRGLINRPTFEVDVDEQR